MTRAPHHEAHSLEWIGLVMHRTRLDAHQTHRVCRLLRDDAFPAAESARIAPALLVFSLLAAALAAGATRTFDLHASGRRGYLRTQPLAADGQGVPTGHGGASMDTRMQAWLAASAAIGASLSAIAQNAQQWTVASGGNGHWYAVVIDASFSNWHVARAAAEARGATLACVETAEEWAFVRDLAGVQGAWNGPHGPWLGGFQNVALGPAIEPAGGWRWISGQPVEFGAWDANQPSNSCSGAPEDFMHLYGGPGIGMRWNDIGLPGRCDTLEVVAAVFEWSEDCNGNGIIDFAELASGAATDTNANGRPDSCELGEVHAWGYPTLVPAEGEIPNALFVETGENFAICLLPDGGIVGWGANEWGQWNAPANAGILQSVACGYAHTIGLRVDGSLVAWGDNQSGQCNVPTGIGRAVAVAAGSGASFAANESGQVFGWGEFPAVPTDLRPVTKVAAGWGIALSIDYVGQLRVWGQNNHGQQDVPSGLGSVLEADGSYGHVAVLRSDRTVACWGLNNAGQCTVPSALPPAVDVDAGAFHTLALLADGTVRAWGAGVPGTAGYPNFGQSTIPSELGTTLQVSGGGYFSVGLSRPSVACVADIDANGIVNGIDLAILLDKWSTNGGKDYPRADIDRSGSIDGADLAQLLSAWGPCP